MASIPFALSVSHFINTVGADAGFAAIIGLALLVLLFFAQMRETAHLRDQAADASDQVQHLEYQLAQLTRQIGAPAAAGGAVAPGATAAPGVVPRPASVPARAQPAVAAATSPASRAMSGPPFAPAGVGAPALASATRLIPAFDDGPIAIRQAGAAAATGLAGSGAGAGAAVGNAAAGSGSRGGAAVITPPGPPPATAAGGANGSAAIPAAAPPPPPVGPRAGQAGRPPAPGNGPRPSGAGGPSRRNYGPESRSRMRGLLVAAIALAVVAAIVVVLLLLTGGGGSPSAASSSTGASSNAPTRHRKSTHHAAVIKPASVNVIVLNGTATTGLAGDISAKLAADSYKMGTAATATDQTHTSTIVGYLPGYRAAALIVAKSLGVPSSAVSPVDQSSQSVACPTGPACTAQVIVTVGADLASAASSSTTPAVQGTSTG